MSSSVMRVLQSIKWNEMKSSIFAYGGLVWPKNTPHLLKLSQSLDLKKLIIKIFLEFETTFCKKNWFQEIRTPQTYTVEFVETSRQLFLSLFFTAVQSIKTHRTHQLQLLHPISQPPALNHWSLKQYVRMHAPTSTSDTCSHESCEQ